MNNNDFSGYGFPKGLYAKAKYYGVPILKTGVVGGAFIVTLMMKDRLFPITWTWQPIVSAILNTLCAFYLVLPTNAGGSNYNAVLYWHRSLFKKKKYWSIDRNCYPEYVTPNPHRKKSFFGRRSIR